MMEIEAKNLSFSYFEDAKNVIEGLNVRITGEDITVLTGVSGCGKSTFLYLAAGLYPHNAGFLKGGCITVNGEELSVLPASERCRRVGMMFQNPDLQFCMDTVFNELVFCLENIRVEPDKIRERAFEALEFCGIPHLAGRRFTTLSGGEKQKAMLACVTALEPEWLLLDEPFANIDDESARDILEKLKKLHEEKNTGILAVDHRIDNWLPVCTKVLVMENGGITERRTDPENTKTVFSFLEERGISTPDSAFLPLAPARTENAKEVLSFERLSLSLKDEETGAEKQILKDISYSFRAGEIYSVTGRSGCGKSSLFGTVSGLYRYTGTIRLEGTDLKKIKDAGRIGFITQSPQDQFIGGTVMDEISAAFREDPEKEKKAEKILRSISLWRYREISPYMLSQGQQRRLGTAALMAYDCRVLICDEPTYAQDFGNTAAIMEGLTALAREKNVTLIFSTHDLKVAEHFSDHMLVLKGGKLIETDQSLL